MNGTGQEVAAYTAVVVAAASAITTFLRGYRKRAADAAVEPYLIGPAAIEEAKAALALKDTRLADLAASESTLRTKLAGAIAQNEAQQEQIGKLQAGMYRLKEQLTEATMRAEEAERRERTSRDRITQLEEDLADLKRKMSLGGQI